MRYQYDNWTCGPCAVINAAEILGRKLALKRAISAAKSSNSKGTSSKGIERAVKAAGLQCEKFKGNHTLLFKKTWKHSRKEKLRACFNQVLFSVKSEPVIICVQNDSHWVTAVGTINDKILVFDPVDGLYLISEQTFEGLIGKHVKTFIGIRVHKPSW